MTVSNNILPFIPKDFSELEKVDNIKIYLFISMLDPLVKVNRKKMKL
jgi:hypothetical protein